MTDFVSAFEKHRNVFWEMYESTGRTVRSDCGGYLIPKGKYEYTPKSLPKQRLLFNFAKKVSSVLEVGTYYGHSLFIMLLANPTIRVTTIDHNGRFANCTVPVLRSHFPQADITFIEGSSDQVIPTLTQTFDAAHIDGAHRLNVVQKEVELCEGLLKRPYQFIFDDAQTMPGLEEWIDQTFSNKTYTKAKGLNPNWYVTAERRRK